jgi:hypothetical protein
VGGATPQRNVTRMETDGSAASTFVTEATINANTWLTIDSGFVYYSNSSNAIRRQPLDNSSAAADVVPGLTNGVRGIAVWQDTVFWLDDTANTLNSRSISMPSNPISTVTIEATSGAGATPQGLATDGTYLFYADSLGSALGIYRYNMDLTGRTPLATFATGNLPNGITIIPAAVPEPSSLALLSILGLVVSRRRKRTV